MSEKYFIVSESELDQLKTEATIDGYCYSDESRDVDEALAACRVRPVPGWATHFVYFSDELTDNPEDGEVWVTQSEKIKK